MTNHPHNLRTDSFPITRYQSVDPDCLPARQFMVQVYALTKNRKGEWRKELLWSFYGETLEIAETEAKRWISAQLGMLQKREADKEARKRGWYDKQVNRARERLQEAESG